MLHMFADHYSRVHFVSLCWYHFSFSDRLKLVKWNYVWRAVIPFPYNNRTPRNTINILLYNSCTYRFQLEKCTKQILNTQISNPATDEQQNPFQSELNSLQTPPPPTPINRHFDATTTHARCSNTTPACFNPKCSVQTNTKSKRINKKVIASILYKNYLNYHCTKHHVETFVA